MSEEKTAMRKIVAVDFYDLIIQQHQLYSEEDIDALFRSYASLGIDTVMWRVSVCGLLLYRTQTPDIVVPVPNRIDSPGLAKAAELLKNYDPAETAVRCGKKYGIKVLFWLTLYDDNGLEINDPMEAHICKEKPHLCWRSKDGREYFHGILSYAYPEVVEFRMRQIRELLAYGADGLYLCNRSHSRPRLLQEAIRDGLHKKDRKAYSALFESEYKRCRGFFGYDPPALETYTGDLDDDEAWQKHRGKYFINFMEKVRAVTAGEIWFGLRTQYGLGSFIYGKHFFDWDRLTDRSITDGLIYELQIPDFDKEEDFPEFYRETASEKYFWFNLNSKTPDTTLRIHAECLERWRPRLDGIVMFEAFDMTYNPQYREFIRNF